MAPAGSTVEEDDGELGTAAQLAALLPARGAQQALLGALAVLLGRGLHAWGPGSAPWARAFLARLACALCHARTGTPTSEDELSAQLDALDGLIFTARTDPSLRPSAFTHDVDPAAAAREGIVTALLAFCACAATPAAAVAEPPADAPADPAASAGGYDARARQLLKGLCLALGVVPSHLLEAEAQLAARVAALRSLRDASAEAPQRQGTSWVRAASIAGAATVGGVLVAATAGLAAPAVGLGLAAISSASGTAAILGPVSAFLGTAAGAATLTSLFGATSAGLAGYRLDRRTRGLSEFRFCRLDTPRAGAEGPSAKPKFGLTRWARWPAAHAPEAQPRQPAAEAAGAEASPARLSVLIGINGWLRCEEDSAEALWRGEPTGGAAAPSAEPQAAAPAASPPPAASAPPFALAQPCAEAWALVWERAELLRLGLAVEQAVRSEAGSMAASELLKHTTLAALMAALAVPSLLLKAGGLIDNPWAVAQARADKAGLLLAELLLARTHGARPVSLVGVSLGGRVALACARALDRAGERGLGLIEDFAVLGAPVEARSDMWAAARRVAAGSVTNCFSANDWVLALVYRANSPAALAGVGGLQPVAWSGVRSVDVSDLIPYHLSYSQPQGLASVLARLASEGAGAGGGGEAFSSVCLECAEAALAGGDPETARVAARDE